MKKFIIISLLFSLIHTSMFSQDKTSQLTYKTGIGGIFFGRGFNTINIGNELHYKYNKFISGSIDLNYGKEIGKTQNTAALFQQNVNLLLSPPSYDARNDLKFGIGFSLMELSRFKNFFQNTYEYDDVIVPGINFILEEDYELNDKYIIGIKGVTQFFYHYGVSGGVLINFGIKL